MRTLCLCKLYCTFYLQLHCYLTIKNKMYFVLVKTDWIWAELCFLVDKTYSHQRESYWELPRTHALRPYWFMLDLPLMVTRRKMEQVKAYFSSVENPSSTLQEPVKDIKGCWLGQGRSGVGQSEESVLQVCQLTDLKQTKEWEGCPNWFRHLCEAHS